VQIYLHACEDSYLYGLSMRLCFQWALLRLHIK
jgi:hypothetical protein